MIYPPQEKRDAGVQEVSQDENPEENTEMKRIEMALVCGACLLVVAAVVYFSAEATAQRRVVTSPQKPDVVPIERANFEVEVLVDGRPLEQYFARQTRYVEAQRNAEYELRIRNPLPVRVAVALAVDGLNSIDARRTSSWSASKWVIAPYQTITISGWQMSAARARRFYFTTEPDSYAAKRGRTADIGNITAVFYREQPQYEPREERPLYREEKEHSGEERRRDVPQSAPNASAGAARRQPNRAVIPAPDDDYAATGIGRSVQHDVRFVNMNLDTRPAGQITVRYEYYPALVRLGILPRPRTEPDPLRRRERARGFDDPRFSPEP